MKRQYINGMMAAITLTFVAALALTAGRARAQIGFMGPVSPFGATMRPLGPQYLTGIGGFRTPFFLVNPQGIRTGYLGPNGAYVNPGYQPPPVGNINGSNLYAPLSPTGTLGNPSDVEVYGAPAGPPVPTSPVVNGAIPRASDTIEAHIDKDNRLTVKWSGDPQLVASIRFALLDKDRKTLKQERITRLPAQATLAITSKTSYYQVVVQYVNGTTTNVVSPL
jgi:hypothetical protein